MRNSATLVSIKERVLRVSVTEQRRRFARQFCTGVFIIVGGHGVDVSAIPSA
jgi:hypothetical protein